MPARIYVELAAGTYAVGAAIQPSGNRWFVGSGAVRSVITTTVLGPIFSLPSGSAVTIDHVELSGATGTNPPGQAINCGNSGTVRLRDVLIQNNGAEGIVGNQCGVTASRTRITNNQRGIVLSSGTASIDRSMIDSNRGVGITFTGGVYSITNTFVTRNVGGISTDVATVQYSTIADNGGTSAPGIACAATATIANSIVARNTPMNTSGTCTPTSSAVATDVSALRFKSPDAPPYDYHLTTGSSAVDHGTAPIDHDYDGDHRPLGSAADLGADEVE